VIVPKSVTLATSEDALTFVAIDFETADHGPDSACAVGLVRVSGSTIVKRKYYLVRPTRRSFFFTPVHGITWEHVRRQPTFEVLWPRIRNLLLGANFIASHSVVCTMKLARQVWNIRPTSLSIVSRYLGLPINHHHALSDAEACARIVVAARRSRAEF
jgi:DNA polymerase III subunit epsilon